MSKTRERADAVAVPRIGIAGRHAGLGLRREHHLLAEHVPASSCCAPTSTNCSASQPSCSAPSNCRVGRSIAAMSSRVDLLIAADQPRVEHEQRREIAEAERAIDARLQRLRVLADRHPLAVRLRARRRAAATSRLRLVVVILRAAAPGVVGELVIVPDDDERVLAVDLLRIGIGLVLRVALAIVLQRHHLLVGRRNAAERGAVAVLLVGDTRRCSRRGAAPRRGRRGWPGTRRR